MTTQPDGAAPADQGQQAGADAQPVPVDAAGLSYEQARDELVEIVSRLEAGGTTLEESLALWDRGEQLAATCQRWLEGARRRVDQVVAARTDRPADPGAPDP